MKAFTFIFMALLSANVSAGPYIDFGLGYIQSIPGKSESTLERNGDVIVRVNDKSDIDLDSPFFTIRAGYRWDETNVHFEYNRFGLLDDTKSSISSWRLYKRLESDIGFYTDLGAGYAFDVPEEKNTETESYGPVTYELKQEATIDLDSPFPMVRLGYRWKTTNIHLEYERVGNMFDDSKSISTLTLNKRWEFDL